MEEVPMERLSKMTLSATIVAGVFLGLLAIVSNAEAGRGGGGGHFGGSGHFGGFGGGHPGGHIGSGHVGGGHMGGSRVHIGGSYSSHVGRHVGGYYGSSKIVRHGGVDRRYSYATPKHSYNRYAGKNHRHAWDDDHHHHHHHYPYYRYRYYGWYPYWGYGYYGRRYSSYSCDWLYRNAVVTNSSYWWTRYYDCIGNY
jgi:hypothetical protein